MPCRIHKFFIAVFIFCFFGTLAVAIAAPKYWIGAAGGNFSSNSNWSLSSGGSNDTTAAGSADTAIFDGGGNTNCTIDANTTLNGLNIKSGYTQTITQATTVTLTVGSQNFTMQGGAFLGGDADIDINGVLRYGNGNFTATSSIMTISGEYTHTTGNGTFSHNGGTVIFDGGAGSNINLNSSETFNNVKFNPTGNFIKTIESGDTLIVAGDVTFSNGQASTGSIEARGSVFVESGWDGGTSTLSFTNAANQVFDPGGSGLYDGDLIVNKSGGRVDLVTTDLTANQVSQDLTIQEGTFDLNGLNLVVNGTSGTVIVETGGNLQLKGSETVTANTGYPQLDSGSKVTYDGNGTNTYAIKDWTYHHLTISSSGTHTMGAAETLGGDLTIASGIYDLNGQNLTVSGTFSNSATVKLKGNETTVSLTMDTDSGTAEYWGSGTMTALKLGNAYYNLNFDNSGGTWQHNAALDVNGSLNIKTGTLDSNGQNVTIAGSWTNTGTYTSGSNTVTFDGTSQTLNGNTTFNNWTKSVASPDTLTLPATLTITVSGTSTLQGAASNLLSLRSTQDGTQTKFDPQGVRAISYVDVKDNNNINAAAVDCTTGCTNSNNNTNWTFSGGGEPSRKRIWLLEDR